MHLTRRMFLVLSSVLTIFGAKAAPAKEIRVENDHLLWGTYGKSGKEPLKWVELRHCETDHLQAILKTQPHVYEPCMSSQLRLKAIQNILKARGADVPAFSNEAYQEFCNKMMNRHG